jgi:hypothetical protein
MKRRLAITRRSVITLTTGRTVRLERHRRMSWTPALALDFGATWVVVRTSATDHVTAADVAFARQLAREANAFAADIARRYSRTTTNRTTKHDHQDEGDTDKEAAA